MTTLAIMAAYEKKRLKCYGTVAAGEHVAVTVADGAQWIGEGKALRLRVLFGPDTVGIFPFADGDAWTATGTQNADAHCELNLNTIPAAKYLKCGGTCLWILDDVENHTLYGTGEFDVLPWPKRRGIDEPIDLDGYSDTVADLQENVSALNSSVTALGNSKANQTALASHTGDSGIHVTAEDKAAWGAKYPKPAGGIPESDLALDVRSSLGKANTALQAHQDISGKADKSDTYTKSETDAKIAAAKNGRFKKVNSLPDVASAESNVIYLVPRSSSETGNVYDEYIVADGAWEKIGSMSGLSLVQSDWNQADASALDFIKNKPETMPPAPHAHTASQVTGLADALAALGERGYLRVQDGHIQAVIPGNNS